MFLFVLLYVWIAVIFILAGVSLYFARSGDGMMSMMVAVWMFLAATASQVAAILMGHRRQIRVLSTRLDALTSARNEEDSN